MPDTSLLYQPNLSAAIGRGRSILVMTSGTPVQPGDHGYDFRGERHWISKEEMECVPFTQSFADYANEPQAAVSVSLAIWDHFHSRPGLTRSKEDIQMDQQYIDHRWTDADYFVLDKYFGRVSTAQLATGIGRPIPEVVKRASDRGIRMRKDVPERAGVTQMIQRVHQSFLGN